MITDIQARTEQEFGAWFQAQGMITEFILYTGYVQQRLGRLSDAYAPGDFYSICNICHSELGRAPAKLEEMLAPDVLTVSVHRHAWAGFTPAQQDQYRSLLHTRGIQLC